MESTLVAVRRFDSRLLSPHHHFGASGESRSEKRSNTHESGAVVTCEEPFSVCAFQMDEWTMKKLWFRANGLGLQLFLFAKTIV